MRALAWAGVVALFCFATWCWLALDARWSS